MTTKKVIHICCVIVIVAVTACKIDPTIRGTTDYAFDFYPRRAKYIYIAPVQKHTIREYLHGQELKHVTYFGLTDGKANRDSVGIYIGIFNCNIDSILSEQSNMSQEEIDYWGNLKDDSLPYVEEQIKTDFLKSVGISVSSTSKSGLAYDNFVIKRIEYSPSEITGMKISALSPIFGKPAGAGLNDYFNIDLYNPPIVVSAPSQRLVYGYTSKEYPASIGEWLSLQPLAQVGMTLIVNKPIPEQLPLNVQFVVEITTKEGKVLRDTTQMITIIE
jgi:hypothetical protein